MSPFKNYKQIKLVIDKLLNSGVSVKLSELLMLLIFQLGSVAHFIVCALESGVL